MPDEDTWNAMGYTEVNPVAGTFRLVRDGGLQSWGRMDMGNGKEAVVAPLTFPNPHSRAVQEGQPVKNCGCGWCNGVRERIARHARGDPCNCQECLDRKPCMECLGTGTVSPQSSLDRGLAAGEGSRCSPPGDTIPVSPLTKSIPEARQVTTPHGRYYELADGSRLPSITTVLKEFAGPNAGLKAWEERVGPEEARRVRERAAAVGTAVHDNIADFLLRETPIPTGDRVVHGHVENILSLLRRRVRHIHAVELPVVHPIGMAGTVDLVCDWVTPSGEERLAVVDYKTKGPRGMHPASLGGYFLQCTAYAQAWKTISGHTPNHIVVIESAAGADSARPHEEKAYPHYARTLGDAPFIDAFARVREACKKW